MQDFLIRTGRGPIAFRHLGKDTIEGEDTAGAQGIGAAEIWRAGYRTAALDIMLVRWPSGLADVRAGDVLSGSEPVKSLARGRLRLGIAPVPQDRIMRAIDDVAFASRPLVWAELRVAAVKERSQGWSNLVNADVPALRAITGSDPSSLFCRSAGALSFGTKADRLGRTDNTRNRLCIVFAESDPKPPLAAFACTRLMPLEDHTG